MLSASPLARGGCRSFPRHRGAPATISGHPNRSLEVPETRKQQRPRRHHVRFASASADIPGLDLDLDLETETDIDRARFPLLRSPSVSHFVNLTNGLEAVPTLLSLGIRDFSLVRLTSTACEQRRHAAVLGEADASLLAALAAGRVAIVWDTSSRERGGEAGGAHASGEDREWAEALLCDDEGAGGGGPGVPRAGGGLRVPRALFWGLELLRYACESRWNGGKDGEDEARGASEGGDGGGGGAATAATETTAAKAPPAASPSSPPPPLLQPPPPSPPPPRAFLGEAGHDATQDFEQALRKEVPDGTKARVRYFRRFYQQQQQQRQQQLSGGGLGLGVRLWGSYRPSRLDRGGGDAESQRAQEALFALAFSKGSSSRGEEFGGSGSSGSGRSREGGGRAGGAGEDSTLLVPLSPPPPFSREALALELQELGWGLFTGGEDRAERLRASRRRREAKRREETENL